jgi:hypothetical protein
LRFVTWLTSVLFDSFEHRYRALLVARHVQAIDIWILTQERSPQVISNSTAEVGTMEVNTLVTAAWLCYDYPR